MLDVTVGEYRVLMDDNGLRAERHGQPWPARDLRGDNLVLVLATEVERLREENAELRAEVASLRDHCRLSAELRQRP